MAFLMGLLKALPAVAGVLGGAAKGSAQERTAQNVAANNANDIASRNYGTQQRAILDALLQQGRDKMSGYETRQGATTQGARTYQDALTSALANQSRENIDRAKLGLDAAGIRARQSILGSLMQNLQPTSIQGPAGQRGHETTITGGLSAANLDPMTRQHGAALMKAALEAQLSGSDIPKATDFRGGVQDWKNTILDVPEATDYSKGIMAPPTPTPYKQAGKGESILSGLGLGLGLAGAVGSAFPGTKKPEDDMWTWDRTAPTPPPGYPT